MTDNKQQFKSDSSTFYSISQIGEVHIHQQSTINHQPSTINKNQDVRVYLIQIKTAIACSVSGLGIKISPLPDTPQKIPNIQSNPHQLTI